MQVWEALQAVRQAAEKENEADMNMGRMVYFLQDQGFPINLCQGEHHIQVDWDEPFHSLSVTLQESHLFTLLDKVSPGIVICLAFWQTLDDIPQQRDFADESLAAFPIFPLFSLQ